ncbi:MAG: extracellular solute-binding protein [Leptolyngbyaceae cyanobacterium SM1_1_3]|nr:extracellular solute-binding protein [Leptolyngbyaceae cyanobacterium SM1_1_3]
MKRRSLLAATAALSAHTLLSACAQPGLATDALQVLLLANAFPPQLLRIFRKELTSLQDCEFSSQDQLSDIYAQLQKWGQAPVKSTRWRIRNPLRRTVVPTGAADLVSLGDYWLASAIEQNLIQPFPSAQPKNWPVSSRWINLVKRDRQGIPAAGGEIWGVPYRWGTLMMVYRDRPFESLGWQPQTWQDLWRPELRGKISLPDHPRIVLGLILKQLEQSSSSTSLMPLLPKLAEQLQSLHRQVKFYSSDHALQALVSSDTWLAVGWSTDILPVMQQYHQLQAVIPKSGTLLTADLWVRPSADAAQSTPAPLLDLAQQWLDFCWRPEIALQLSLSGGGASPRFADESTATLPVLLRDRPLLVPGADVFAKSEFLQPLPTESAQAIASLWDDVRQSG